MESNDVADRRNLAERIWLSVVPYWQQILSMDWPTPDSKSTDEMAEIGLLYDGE